MSWKSACISKESIRLCRGFEVHSGLERSCEQHIQARDQSSGTRHAVFLDLFLTEHLCSWFCSWLCIWSDDGALDCALTVHLSGWLCICKIDCALTVHLSTELCIGNLWLCIWSWDLSSQGRSVEFPGTRGRCLVISGTSDCALSYCGWNVSQKCRKEWYFGILISKLFDLRYGLARNLDSWNVYRKGRSTHNSVSHLDSLKTSKSKESVIWIHSPLVSFKESIIRIHSPPIGSQGINHQDLFSLKSSQVQV